MSSVLEKFIMYLEYPFVRYALIVGTLISLCASLLGVVLVLRRYSFIGNGLSHLAFGLMCIASVVGIISELPLVLSITIIGAIILLNVDRFSNMSGDTAVAMLSVSALSLGYLVMNVFPSKTGNVSADVCATLFGSTSILTLSSNEVVLTILLSILVLMFFIFTYNKMFAITFDESFAQATGTNVDLYNNIFATVMAVVIVLAVKLVGSLLISALIVFPTVSAMRLKNNFKAVTLLSAILSIICTFSGISISILIGTPVGSTIVLINMLAFIICSIVGGLKK